MTDFDSFVLKASEQKLPALTLDLAWSHPCWCSELALFLLRQDSMAWGMPTGSYTLWEVEKP